MIDTQTDKYRGVGGRSDELKRISHSEKKEWELEKKENKTNSNNIGVKLGCTLTRLLVRTYHN